MTSKQNLTVILTGGTGFIGRRLLELLLGEGGDANISEMISSDLGDISIHVLSRQSSDELSRRYAVFAKGIEAKKITLHSGIESLPTEDVDVLVNLAGEGIADKRWTSARKRALKDSRIGLTKELYEHFKSADTMPRTVLSASAIGYYGARSQDGQAFTESSPKGSGFASELCAEWEAAARLFTIHCANRSSACKLTILRLAVVLDRARDGGFLGRMRPIFKLGLGGPIGNGEQYFNWIHREDVCRVILSTIDKNLALGAADSPFEKPKTDPVEIINLVADDTTQQKDFAACYGAILGRPAFIPTPALVLRLAFGELADELLLEGERVVSKHLPKSSLRFPILEDALKACEKVSRSKA